MSRPLRFLFCLTVSAILFVSTGCGSYGTELNFSNGVQLYYADPVTKDEAEKLGRWLEAVYHGAPPGELNRKKTFQLKRRGDLYQFRVVVDPALMDRIETENRLRRVAAAVRHQVFEDRPLELHMCDSRLQTVKVVIP